MLNMFNSIKLYSLLFLCLLEYTHVFAQREKYEKPAGKIIAHSPASSGKYIGSPAIAILSNGDYIVSHDFFGPQAKERINGGVTVLYLSSNKGKSWKKIAQLNGQFWSNIFEHHGAVYIFGTDKEYGNVIIRKSEDGGYTWTEPVDANTGIILSGKYATAPVPIVMLNNKIYRAIEQIDERRSGWGKIFMSSMISIPADVDLLKAENWSQTNSLPFNPAYLNGEFGAWLEGNAVVFKDSIVNVMRVHTNIPGTEKAAIVRLINDKVHFDPERDFIDFPGGSKKFTIRYDAKSKLYWTLSNVISEKYKELKITDKIRNTVALCSSADLRNWNIHKHILHHDDMHKHGYQYIDWQFENNNIILVSRTAFGDKYGGVHRQHDANYLTFYRIKNFRKYRNFKQ